MAHRVEEPDLQYTLPILAQSLRHANVAQRISHQEHVGTRIYDCLEVLEFVGDFTHTYSAVITIFETVIDSQLQYKEFFKKYV